MADAITIKALQDASLDAKSLEEVVNGNDAKQVTTRLGESYPSVKKAIKTLFENGGLPATPFATKALMTASALVDGKYAMVTDDSVAENNGLYVKTAGAWVKSEYDSTALANTYTDSKVKGVTNNFKTKALLTASTLPNDSYAMVTEDTEANNGLYVKTAEVWVKSEYDPLAQSKEYSDKVSDDLTELILSDRTKYSVFNIDSNDGDILKLADSNYDVIAKIDKDAKLFLSDLDEDVQSILHRVPKNNTPDFYGAVTPPNDLVQIHDTNYNCLMRIDENKKVYVSGMTESLQDKLNISGTPNLHPRRSAQRLTESSLSALSYLPYSGLNYAPCPMQLLPQKYSVSDVEIKKLTITETPQQLVIDTTYNKDDKVVHPSIIEFYGSFRGYRYLMVINPYVTASIENPIIYGSNDLVNFEMLDGFVQPLAFAPYNGFLSDPCLTYDPINGELVCIYRESKESAEGQITATKCRTTSNGYDWSESHFILDFTPQAGVGGKKLSPAVLYNPDTRLWMMWINDGSGEISLWTSSSLKGVWSKIHTKRYPTSLWHLEVKYIGGMFCMVVADSEGGSNYGVMTSSNGEDWVYQTNLFPTNQSGRYKGSFLVEMDEETEELNLFFIWTDNLLRKAFTARTNKIQYEELP